MIVWTGWDLNPRPPTFPLREWHARQVFYQAKLPALQTKPKISDNLSV